MFDIEQDRCDYGRLLAPPEGFELDAAVATTYSLDLETLTFAAIALGHGENTDSMLKDNPVSMLNALRKIRDKVVIFYETGRIAVPASRRTSNFYQLLEGMTVPVALPAHKGNNYPSFHPKMWLICYMNRGSRERRYRFLVMSRNLTFDRSWDVVVSLDGIPTEQRQERSLPIVHFLNFLGGFTKKDSRTYGIVDSLGKFVKNVSFSLEGNKITDFCIIPLGIGRNSYDLSNDVWFKESSNFHEVVIMSPFISADVISLFNNEIRGKYLSSCKRTLITRTSELSKLSNITAGNFEIYTMKDGIVEGENELSDGDVSEVIRRQDIHAKMLLFRKNDFSSVYMGSMNVSHNGMYRNVELDIRFDCPNSYLRPDRFLAEVFGNNPLKNPFELRTLEEDTKQEATDNGVDVMFKKLCRADAMATVVRQEDGLFTISLRFNPSMISDGVMISPISKNIHKPIEPEIIFESLSVLELTEYYQIVLTDSNGKEVRHVMQIPTQGIPAERDKQICNSILDSKEKLYEYISLILSDDKVQCVLESGDSSYGEGEHGTAVTVMPAIYERMLEASLHHRERFMEIEDMMKMLPDNSSILEEFKKLYDVFCEALKT